MMISKTILLQLGVAILLITLSVTSVFAAHISYVSGAVGADIENFNTLVEPWEKKTGHNVTVVPMPNSTTDQFAQYRLWLAAGSRDIDVYQTDVIWAPQLAEHFVDLSSVAGELAKLHFPAVIESQTVGDKLVAMPIYTDAPALYYRKDLLEKYKQSVPKTWEEMTEVAQTIQNAERASGNHDLWGYVWQGNAYEGLTCDALEWVKSSGGGQIIEADGTISINNENAAKAIDLAASWVGSISPKGVLGYGEEESRGVWQTGNAVFMRNWPYAYALGNDEDSAVKGLFDVTTLPTGKGHDTSAATLGGWNVAVSKYSENQDAAISLVMYLSSAEAHKWRALNESKLPTVMSLYEDAEIATEQPVVPRWKNVFLQAVPRPSAPTGSKYNEASSLFWSAVHDTLSGKGSAAKNLAVLEAYLEDLRGGERW